MGLKKLEICIVITQNIKGEVWFSSCEELIDLTGQQHVKEALKPCLFYLFKYFLSLNVLQSDLLHTMQIFIEINYKCFIQITVMLHSSDGLLHK